MNLQNTALDETKQTGQAVDGDDRFGGDVLGISGLQDFVALPLPGMCLEQVQPGN